MEQDNITQTGRGGQRECGEHHCLVAGNQVYQSTKSMLSWTGSFRAHKVKVTALLNTHIGCLRSSSAGTSLKVPNGITSRVSMLVKSGSRDIAAGRTMCVCEPL